MNIFDEAKARLSKKKIIKSEELGDFLANLVISASDTSGARPMPDIDPDDWQREMTLLELFLAEIAIADLIKDRQIYPSVMQAYHNKAKDLLNESSSLAWLFNQKRDEEYHAAMLEGINNNRIPEELSNVFCNSLLRPRDFYCFATMNLLISSLLHLNRTRFGWLQELTIA